MKYFTVTSVEDPIINSIGVNSTVINSNDKKSIILSQHVLTGFINDYRATYGLDPTAGQVQQFKENWVREEILYREGLLLGLNRNDLIIRQRIIKKMQLLTAETPSTLPSDADLRAVLEKNRQAYSLPATVSVEMLLFETGGTSLPDSDPISFQTALNALESGADPKQIGLPYQRAVQKSTAYFEAVYGEDFISLLKQLNTLENKHFSEGTFEVLAQLQKQQYLPIFKWQKYTTKKGDVLALFYDYNPVQVPPFEQLKSRLTVDWRKAQSIKAAEQQLADLRAKYTVLWSE